MMPSTHKIMFNARQGSPSGDTPREGHLST